MVEEYFGDVQVDVCSKGCKGIWFDWDELVRLDENSEGAGYALEEALKSPRFKQEDREKLFCPRCGISMHAHKYSSAKEVSVDECYGCGGFFLDSGELKEIRGQYMSEEERDAYVGKLLADIPEFKEMEEETKRGRVKLRTSAGEKLGDFLRMSKFTLD
jgi:Zn-finger nucleic acid-binding protein